MALTKSIFGLKALTSTLHQLLHIKDSVRVFGPLFAHSTYPFESENFQILNSVKSAKGVTSQIVTSINLKFAI